MDINRHFVLIKSKKTGRSIRRRSGRERRYIYKLEEGRVNRGKAIGYMVIYIALSTLPCLQIYDQECLDT